MVSIAVAGRSDDQSPDAEVIELPQDVPRSSISVGLDGESAMCPVEFSRALHRASIALDGMGPGTLAQSWTGRRRQHGVDGNTPEGVEPDTVQGNVNKAIALVDGLNEARTAQLEDGTNAGLAVVAAHAAGESRPNRAHGVAPENAGALQEILEHIAGELNTSVIRGSFEASLMLSGALQHVSDHEATERIRTVIDLLDENTREVRTLIFGFNHLAGQADAE